MRAIRRLLLSLVVFGALAPLPACKNNGQPSQAPAVGPAIVTIDTAERKLPFHVELALTGEEQNRGLMFRKTMATDAGMLFVFDRQSVHTFWMKNTLIPLDIIFIRSDGTIVRITHAKALDESPLPSGEPVAVVLEIRGGRAAELGIKEGDVASWPR